MWCVRLCVPCLRVHSILWLTGVVGFRKPGLHPVFSPPVGFTFWALSAVFCVLFPLSSILFLHNLQPGCVLHSVLITDSFQLFRIAPSPVFSIVEILTFIIVIFHFRISFFKKKKISSRLLKLFCYPISLSYQSQSYLVTVIFGPLLDLFKLIIPLVFSFGDI